MPADWRSFAIVPAAGRSLRMGRPKLLLPWGKKTVIQHTLAAWRAGGVTHTVITTRPDDLELASLAREDGAEVVTPAIAPAEMKDSIRLALDYIREQYQPSAQDVWLLAPADMPWLSVTVVRQLLAAHSPSSPRILLPVLSEDAQTGHPVLIPWSLAEEVARLACHEGVNAITQRNGWTPIVVSEDAIYHDLDTPEDYDRLKRSPAP